MIYNLETPQSLTELCQNSYENNYHVAIIGEEKWQFGHGNWWNLIQCKYNLDFMSNSENQEMFKKLVETFLLTKKKDELYNRFTNALVLFEKSLEQHENYKDDTLSLIILFSAAESLLTEGNNEKRLRLSVIWPRLVTVTDTTQKELSILIRDLYLKRNNFVHAGSIVYNRDASRIRILYQMLAKLIMLYISRSVWSNIDTDSDINDLTQWNNYIKKVFDDAIYN